MPRSDEQQGPVYPVQHASRHTPVEHAGQAAPTVTGQSDEVRTFPFDSVYDRLHHRAMDNAPSGPSDTFLTELPL